MAEGTEAHVRHAIGLAMVLVLTAGPGQSAPALTDPLAGFDATAGFRYVLRRVR
jgi:hypothetical protein